MSKIKIWILGFVVALIGIMHCGPAATLSKISPTEPGACYFESQTGERTLLTKINTYEDCVKEAKTTHRQYQLIFVPDDGGKIRLPIYFGDIKGTCYVIEYGKDGGKTRRNISSPLFGEIDTYDKCLEQAQNNYRTYQLIFVTKEGKEIKLAVYSGLPRPTDEINHPADEK